MIRHSENANKNLVLVNHLLVLILLHNPIDNYDLHKKNDNLMNFYDFKVSGARDGT